MTSSPIRQLHTSRVSVQQSDDAEPAALATATQVDIAALYARYHARLRAHALRCLPRDLHHEADTALMTVFTRLVASRVEGRLEEQPNWEAYLKRSVKNACLDILKADHGDQKIDPDDPRIHREAAADPTGDTAADRTDHHERVRRAKAALDGLDSVDPRLRIIVVGKLVNERTNRDLGQEFGLTGQRVSQLYDKALELLREEVNRNDGQ